MAAITSVQYLDPFAPLPIGFFQTGVDAQLSGAPDGTVAYAQLVSGSTPIGWGSASTNIEVRVWNTVPLAPAESYELQVMFDKAGKNAENLPWSDSTKVISSPVVVLQARITGLSVTATGLTVSWDVPGTAAVAAVYIEVVDLTNEITPVAWYLGSDPSADIEASFVAGITYGVRASCVQSVLPDTFGGEPNYVMGPPGIPQPIPVAAVTLSAVTYSGDSVSAQWTAPAAVAGTPTPSYELVLLSGASVVAVGTGGPSGGQLSTGDLRGTVDPKVGVRMSYGSFGGAVGPTAPLYTSPPHILSSSVTGSTTFTFTAFVTAAPGPLPTGGSLVATLYNNGTPEATQTLAAVSGSVTWSDISAVGDIDFGVDVVQQVVAGGVTSTGAPSERLSLPAAAPTSASAEYDGQHLEIDVVYPAVAGVDAFLVSLTGSTGGSHELRVGGQLPIAAALALDLGQTWSATVTPFRGTTTLPAVVADVALPTVAAPVITSVAYDGTELVVQWTAAELPGLTGYRVTVSGGPTLVTGAGQTTSVLPLGLAGATGATVTVTGLSALRDTAPSASVVVVSGDVSITSVTVGSTVTAAWTITPSPSQVRAMLTVDDSVVGVIADATATGATFALPGPTGRPYRLSVRAASSDGVSLGPVSEAVPLLLTAPTLESGYLGENGQLTLRWGQADSFGIAGYRLVATPTTGTPATLLAGADGYTGPAPAAFSAPGTLTVTPVNASCVGAATSATIAAPATITTGDYTGDRITLSITAGGATAADTSWLEVLVDGVVVSRRVAAGADAGPFALPIALPPGATATARLTLIGPAVLAPAASPAVIPTATPAVLGAAYDGTTLHVSWKPTRQPGVTGYLVSVTGTGIDPVYVAGAAASTASLTTTLDYPFVAGVLVNVRAVAGTPAGDGPSITGPASPGLPPTLAGHTYATAVGAAGNPPYLYRRGAYQALTDIAGTAIVVYLAKPFTGPDNPTVSSTGSSFVLAPAPSGASLPYQLTLSAGVWSTLGAAPVRTGLHDEYVQFLSDVEGNGVFAWSIGLLRQVIAGAMPQTLEEVPYYRYGYWHSDQLRVVDVMPGTRLQLATALYQSIVGGVNEKNGYLALGNEALDVVDAVPQGGASTLPTGAGRILSVDAFLSLAYPGAGAGTSARRVAAGPLDLFADQNRQSYYRLFYPTNFLSSDSNGSTALTDNIALVGTTSWATMAAVTAEYATTGTFPTGVDYFATYFRGRAGVTPLINVTIQGESRWVALGTTVRQALASIGLSPFDGAAVGEALTMLRPTANLFTWPAPDVGLSLDPVDLGNAGLGGLTPSYWPLDMPLVGGDQIGLRAASPA